MIKVGLGDNTAASDDNEFMNNIANDFLTIANTGKLNNHLTSLQRLLTMWCNVNN